jgi:hypothetical protein
MKNECFVCFLPPNQKAHIIGNRKVNRKLYGNAVIDSELNLLPACSLHCNSLIDLGFHENLKEQVADIIESKNMDECDKRLEIEFIVNRNIERKKAKL